MPGRSKAFRLLTSGTSLVRLHLRATDRPPSGSFRLYEPIVLAILVLGSASLVSCAAAGPSPVKQLDGIVQNDKRQTEAIRQAVQRCKADAEIRLSPRIILGPFSA